MAWHPSPDEIYVFRRDDSQRRRVVLLIPGATEAPSEILIDGYAYEPDEDATDHARMFVSVDNRKRLTFDADTR